MKRGLQTVPQCLPSSVCIFLLPRPPLARCLNPFYTKAKNWLQEGVKRGLCVAERQQQRHHPVLWTLTLYSWSVSLGKECPEGLIKPKIRSEEHSCASSAWLPSPGGRGKTQSSIRWSRLLPVHSNPEASLLWASTEQQESLSTGYACPTDKATVVCLILTIPSSPHGLWPQNHV